MDLVRRLAAIHLTDARRAQHRALLRELGTYRPGREIEDLIATLDIPGEDLADDVRELRDALHRPVWSANYHFMRAV